jgi:hypothetical protein
MRWVLATVACSLALGAEAECTRFKREQVPAGFDGPGSWGPLNNTLTLDCLTYAGSIVRDRIEYVLIRDEKGGVYRLKVGDFMGEKSGHIIKIDESFIYIEQYAGPQKRSMMMKFPKFNRTE